VLPARLSMTTGRSLNITTKSQIVNFALLGSILMLKVHLDPAPIVQQGVSKTMKVLYLLTNTMISTTVLFAPLVSTQIGKTGLKATN
jgi:hypothetical protein